MRIKIGLGASALAGIGLLAACETDTGPVERQLVVGPAPVPCSGEPAATCLNVSDPMGDQWIMRFDEIEGFTYEPGFNYRLLVREPSLAGEVTALIVPRLSLIRVISKEAVHGDDAESASPLGRVRWLLQNLTPSRPTGIAWPDSKISAEFHVAGGWVNGFSGCNTYLAALSVHGDEINLSAPATTRKLCPGPVMDLEKAYLEGLAKATSFMLTDDTLELTLANGKMLFRDADR